MKQRYVISIWYGYVSPSAALLSAAAKRRRLDPYYFAPKIIKTDPASIQHNAPSEKQPLLRITQQKQESELTATLQVADCQSQHALKIHLS